MWALYILSMSFLPKTIYLIDSNTSLVEGWASEFSEYPSVIPLDDDYFCKPADCIVSPANSFGYMDGGLDRAILYELGDQIQTSVQNSIKEKFHGELPIGSSLIIETNNSKWPYLICAPTMRVPENVSGTLNAYLAFKAILSEIVCLNKAVPNTITSLVCCGLATGIGGLNVSLCAKQMKYAYELMLEKPKTLNPNQVYESELFMRETSDV